jgi:hypothetical protein
MPITKEQTVTAMVASLERAAKQARVSLKGVTRENFNSELDDRFHDGGEARCEQFGDLTWAYATQFGAFDSQEWEDARWECFEAAFVIIEARYPARRKASYYSISCAARTMALRALTNGGTKLIDQAHWRIFSGPCDTKVEALRLGREALGPYVVGNRAQQGYYEHFRVVSRSMLRQYGIYPHIAREKV